MERTNLIDLPLGKNPPKVVNAVVEIPRGGHNKFEYDKELQIFRLDRVLYSAVHYPGDYCFIPSTLTSDGDPLDVLIMTNEPTFMGVLMDVRPIGVFYMMDEKGKDEKIISVPHRDPFHSSIQDITDLPRHFTREVDHFFSIYKELEGKQVKTFGYKGLQQAENIIIEGHEAYNRKA